MATTVSTSTLGAGKTTVNSSSTWGRVSFSVFLELLLKTHEEVMRQNAQRHMMMPSDPGAHLIVSHSQHLFAILKTDFNGPAHATDFNQGSQFCLSGSV